MQDAINHALDSQVIAALVTVFGTLGVTYLAYFLSKKRNKRVKNKTRDDVDYSKYEAIIVQQNKELERVYAVAKDREELISRLRLENDALYKTIEAKNSEIEQLRYMRQTAEKALHSNDGGIMESVDK